MHSQLMRIVGGSLAVVILAGGCAAEDSGDDDGGGDDDDPAYLDASGDWGMTITFGEGDCLEPGSTFAVVYSFSDVGDTYLIENSDDSVNITSGTVACDLDSCRATFDVAYSVTEPSPYNGAEAFDVTLSDDDSLAGSWATSVTFQDATTCTQVGDIEGARS